MTNKRALEFAKQECAAYKRKIENGYVYYQNIVDYYEIVIDALEKKIPKKPICGDYSDQYWCPSCDSTDEMDIHGTDFCPYCGQALDWDEEYDKWGEEE